MTIEENGTIENFQIIACLTSFFLFLLGAKLQFSKKRLDQSAVSLFFSMVPFVGAGREASFGAVLGISGNQLIYTKYLLALFLVIVLSLSLAFLITAYRRRELHWRLALLGYNFLFFAFLVIVFAQILEKGQLGFPKNQNFEELLELLGYSLLAYLSFYRLKSARE